MRLCDSIYAATAILFLVAGGLQAEEKEPLEAEDPPAPVRSEKLYKEGLALQKDGKLAEAIARWDEALKVDPQNWACLNHYAWFLAVTAPQKHPDRGDPQRALKLATEAAEITQWKNHDVLDTVAECHFVLKDFKKAVATQLMALAGGTTGNAKEKYLRAQLEKFEAAMKSTSGKTTERTESAEEKQEK